MKAGSGKRAVAPVSGGASGGIDGTGLGGASGGIDGTGLGGGSAEPVAAPDTQIDQVRRLIVGARISVEQMQGNYAEGSALHDHCSAVIADLAVALALLVD